MDIIHINWEILQKCRTPNSNPIKHLDILGTIMILISGFGWAKPVPINPMYYNDMKKGTTLVSLAGPLSNIFLALLFSFPMAFIGNQYAMLSFDTIFTANSLIFFRGFDFSYTIQFKQTFLYNKY